MGQSDLRLSLVNIAAPPDFRGVLCRGYQADTAFFGIYTSVHPLFISE